MIFQRLIIFKKINSYFISCNMSKNVKIAVVQLTSTSDKNKNFQVSKDFIEKAAKSHAKMVFLPENFDFISENREQSFELYEDVSGPLINAYKMLAKKNNVFLSLGGFHRKDENIDSSKMFNSHIIIDNNGNIKCVYDKLHLFDVEIPNSVSLKESNIIEAGYGLKDPVDTPIGKVGLSICYDLRFPEVSQGLREMGATILTYPSAFTAKTGEAHWHILMRARAIETQCFVIAAAQEGQHNTKRTSYGHSIAVDPWGSIVGEISDPGPGIMFCELDLNKIQTCRTNMPCFNHRRLDLFPSFTKQGDAVDIGVSSLSFGSISILADCIFYKSRLSYAFVNISPLVPGHVLVSPIRKVERFCDLSPIEVSDLYAVVRIISPKLMTHFQAASLTISQQDGKDAGQSVPHVHIHVLPRKPGDFPENDDIYKALQKHDKGSNKERKYRSNQEMKNEAEIFGKLFY